VVVATFSASVDVDCEYEDAFREGMGEISQDSKDLAGYGKHLFAIQSFGILTFILNML